MDEKGSRTGLPLQGTCAPIQCPQHQLLDATVNEAGSVIAHGADSEHRRSADLPVIKVTLKPAVYNSV